MPKHTVEIDYTNWRGERAIRRIRPVDIVMGRNSFHEGEQWLLRAWDEDRKAHREFAMAGIHSWKPAAEV